MASITVESWIWYSFVILMVTMRFTARLSLFKSIWRLQAEDWLMLFLTCLYTILIVFLNIDATVNTNLIPPDDVPHLTQQDIQQRTWGSKTVLLVEQCMCAVQWGTKVCLLILYWRLTENLTQNLVVKLVAAYVAATYVVMEVLYFGYWCRPLHDYWKTPTSNVECTTALHHLILNLAFNLSSDLMIMSIPIPMILKAHMDRKRKFLLVFPFSLGIFTIACAIASKHLTFTQPFSAEWVFWYTRESSTAMIVTNMPYTWALIRRAFHLKSFFGESDHAITLNGVSQRGGSNATAQSMHKPHRGSIFSLGRKSGKNSNAEPKDSQESEMQMTSKTSWNRDEKNVGTAADSLGSTSGGSVVKPPASGTQAALDKLYALEDEDLDLIEAKEQERANRGRLYSCGDISPKTFRNFWTLKAQFEAFPSKGAESSASGFGRWLELGCETKDLIHLDSSTTADKAILAPYYVTRSNHRLDFPKLRCKGKNSSPSESPPPPCPKSHTTEDEARLPGGLEAIVLSALNPPLFTCAALSASSLTSARSTGKPIPTTAIKSTKPEKTMPPPRPVHLLIASLGNPAPYHNTRHSAGHILLKSLASHLNAPPPHKSRDYGGPVTSTTTESGTNWTLFQSPSLMNVSGPAVLKAFKTFTSQYSRSSDYECGLVILHDELELDSGKAKVKRGESSAKGHNGIKSIQQSLQGAGLTEYLGARFIKVGVGIGRPVSRDRDEVSGYVLGQLSGGERTKIEGAAEGVVHLLEMEAQRIGK